MRAALVANTVHVPDTWGGWRVHGSQATAGIGFGSSEQAGKIDDMIEHAIQTSQEILPSALRQRLVSSWSVEARERRAFTREVAARYNSTFRRRNFILRRFLTASIPAREYVKSRLYGGCPSDWVRRCLDEAGHGPAFASANRSSEHHPQ